MEEPLVSVIMNCFNGAKYLREAIDSVYAQTYRNWEIVFWDNASTDQSGEIATKYDSRLRYFRGSETIPLGAARNKALEQTRGDFIAFLDTDDLWLPEKLEHQVCAMLQDDYALSYTGVTEMDASGNTIRTLLPKYKSGFMFPEQLVQFDITVPAVMVRKSALTDLGLGFDDRIVASEEYCLFMQLAVHRNFCAIEEPLAKWRIHNQSLTDKAIKKWAEEREYTLETIKKRNPGIEKKYPSEFAEAYGRANYYRARYLMSLPDKIGARAALGKSVFVGIKYMFLYVILLLPTGVWNLVHREEVKRRLIRLLGVSRYAN